MATATPVPSGTLDFGRCFSFFTEDPDWIKKVLIGGLFALLSPILIGVPFLLGYFSRTLRNVAAGAARPMPDWDDLGGLFSEGLRLTAVYLLYVLGIMIVMGVLALVLILPFIALSGAEHGSDGSEGLAALGGLGIVAFYGLVMLVSLAMMVYLPAALTRSAMLGTIGAGFAFGQNLSFIRLNLGNYFLSILVYLLAAFVAQFGILLCCVGLFPAAFASYLVLAVALGQTVRLNPSSI